MKVLIIDNKDSFTYNLKHYINFFCDHVDVVRSDNLELKSVSEYDKILLSPGPGTAKEYPILHDVLSKYGPSKSILGVCLGQQAIADFYGGVLDNLPAVMHGISSSVNHFDNCYLYNDIPLNFQAGHYHSWVVSNNNFPSHLEVTSATKSGLIMSLKHKKYNVKGVQFHPESILTEYGFKLIENWLFN